MTGFIDKDGIYNYNIIIEIPRFEWDENKNTINKIKHHVTFEEAKTVFDDVEALVIDDPDHSQNEERFIILGFSTLQQFTAFKPLAHRPKPMLAKP